MRKRIGFVPEDNDENENEDREPNVSEQLIIAYFNENYEPSGFVAQMEFRTTLELVNELSETVLVPMSVMNSILTKLGYRIKFIDGVSNWVLYEKVKRDHPLYDIDIDII